jgi:hypothetical protein
VQSIGRVIHDMEDHHHYPFNPSSPLPLPAPKTSQTYIHILSTRKVAASPLYVAGLVNTGLFGGRFRLRASRVWNTGGASASRIAAAIIGNSHAPTTWHIVEAKAIIMSGLPHRKTETRHRSRAIALRLRAYIVDYALSDGLHDEAH